jgi:hypothetical protein
MKKLYFISLSLFVSFGLNAQILNQSNHAPVIGEMYRTTDVSTVGVTPGSSGSGVTWDMSAISIGTTITNFSVVTVPSSSASAYPSASLAIEPSSGVNNFYSASSSSLKYWGGDIVVSSYNINLNYTSPAVFAAYPVTFSSTNSVSIAGNLSAGASISGSFTGTCTTNADGTGILALPSRTFTNCMRLKITQDISFTTSFGNGTLTQVNYEYYNSLSKTPLFTISTSTIVVPIVGTTNQMAVNINSDYQFVGIKENIKDISNLNLFPNPAKNNFNLSFVNENAEAISLEIINALGQTVRKESLGNTKGMINQSVDVSNVEAGVYFVKVNVGERTSTKKLTIQ